ncbi:PTS sugar transporter subunit IIB [Lacticaseibacillus casei]|uniref:PTS sugar transporter subunit IIB n=1 Tax=Lacticaseibacillus casei TaxID=1582 RepID=UPI001108DE38|nr:PTS sugar transporter subunit IIB [Lacticaseibacillus casei]TLQ50822.1 PTS sugar transporter subunit IIB [Lacticaseibacillus casei]
MTEKKIMLICAAGMSTSMLVARMQKAAEKDGITVNIFATSASDADNKLAAEKPDVLMLGEKVLKASLKAIDDGKGAAS